MGGEMMAGRIFTIPFAIPRQFSEYGNNPGNNPRRQPALIIKEFFAL